MMRKTLAGFALAAALVVPAGSVSAAPHSEPASVADSGSASTGSATQSLCLLLRMLRAGYVDSSGGGPACTFP
ncbi:hypothetical protein ABZV58_05980 [Nocardia sp. NPDC004654]|uniref:hypothetical protein n=1 Tax=Nocardia sp. NPDC004654 TaxID=3154776 RepID=UPI00339E622D